MVKNVERSTEDGDVDYGGVVCTSPTCEWSGDDPGQQRCSVCGSWTRFWITNDQSLIPPDVRWRILPPPPEEH